MAGMNGHKPRDERSDSRGLPARELRCRWDTPGIAALIPGLGIRSKPEVALDAAPAAMNVIRGIAPRVCLDIEELDQERRALHTIRVALARAFRRTGEGKVN